MKMNYTVQELENLLEKEREMLAVWEDEYYHKGTIEGPHHREIQRLESILALVKLGVEIADVRNGIAFINTPKGHVMQYGLRSGKWRLENDRVWLGSRSPKIFVEKFLSQE